MRVVVDYQDEQHEFDVAEDRVVACFQGPSGVPKSARRTAIIEAMERPIDLPPLSRMLVSGDRIAIALGAGIPGAEEILSAFLPIVREAVGEAGEIVVVTGPDRAAGLSDRLPAESRLVIHDPSDRNQLAYLASTQGGRRVYLNRQLTDADAVISIGELRFDGDLSCRGPWSALFPDLSDEETRKDFQSTPAAGSSRTSNPNRTTRIDESMEAGWLLGSQFFVGLVPGRSGFSGVIAGLSRSVLDHGLKAMTRDWDFAVESRAELVVAGVGRGGAPTGLDALIAGIESASKLVQHGGKIIMLSRAEGPIGPAMRRLIDAGEPRRGTAALRGHEEDADHRIAVRLNAALAWADLYLISSLDSQTVEDLSIVPLEKVSEASRIASTGRSCIFLSQADLCGLA